MSYTELNPGSGGDKIVDVALTLADGTVVKLPLSAVALEDGTVVAKASPLPVADTTIVALLERQNTLLQELRDILLERLR